MTKVKCDVCKFEGDPATTFERQDGIVRCKVCVWRAYAPGQGFVNEAMAEDLADQGIQPVFMRPDDPLRKPEAG